MAESTLRLMCPNLTCRSLLTVPTSARGRVVKCGSCKRTFRVPGGGPAAAAVAQPAPVAPKAKPE